VVHLPKALIKSFAPVIFFPSHGAKGSNFSNLFESGLIITFTFDPSQSGSIYPLSSTSKPLGGNSQPVGSSNLTSSPRLLNNESVFGLNPKSPEIAIAATISGEATKACVFGFPSALFAKFLLKECMIEFFSCLSATSLAH